MPNSAQPSPKPGKRRLAIALCALGTVGVVALLLWLGHLDTLRQNPARAFEDSDLPESGSVGYADAPGSVEGDGSGEDIDSAPAETPDDERDMRVLGAMTYSQQETINLVLLGIDSDAARAQRAKNFRSDTIIVLAIHIKTNTCTAIHIPRDTRTAVAKLDKDGKTLRTVTDKINAAYAYGQQGKYSAQNTLQAISTLFESQRVHIPLKYYAALDMDGIAPMTDALGGVEITLSHDLPGFGEAGEAITLRGDEAREFVRKRKGYKDGSDLTRISHQQDFLKAMAKRIKALGVGAVPRLWNSLSKNVFTNLNLEQIIVLASVLQKLDIDDIHFVTIPGKPRTISGTSYFIPDKAALRELLLEIYANP